MHIIYVPTGIKKPFAFIDKCIITALKRIGLSVILLEPGSDWEQPYKMSIIQKKPILLLAMLVADKLTESNIQQLKEMTLPKVVWYTDDPYAIDKTLHSQSFFDFIFTNESEAVSIYKKKSTHVAHLPLAAPYPNYSPLNDVHRNYKSDLTLVGCGFKNRIRTLKHLAPSLKSTKTRLVGPGWNELSCFRQFIIKEKWVDANEARKYYNGATITLNIHRSYDDTHLNLNQSGIQAYTPNNRTFEVAACCAFQLMDYRPDIEILYDPNKEMIYTKTLQELKEKVCFYLKRESLMKAIAQRAFQRTLKEHLYEHRLIKLLTKVIPTWKSQKNTS